VIPSSPGKDSKGPAVQKEEGTSLASDLDSRTIRRRSRAWPPTFVPSGRQGSAPTR